MDASIPRLMLLAASVLAAACALAGCGSGWTRDFFTVLAAPASSPAAAPDLARFRL